MADGFDYEKAVQAIAEAPFAEDWQEALAQTSLAGGGWAGQLIGVSKTAGLQFDLVYRAPLDAIAEFERRGGVDPALSPRAQVFFRRPLEVLGEEDILSPDEQRGDPLRDLYDGADAPFVCISRLPVSRDLDVVLAALRSRRAGRVQAEEKERFAALLPHTVAALRIQARLEHEASSVAAGALEVLSSPVFLMGVSGEVVAMTAPAEAAARDGAFVRLRGSRLEARTARSDSDLQAALRLASRRAQGGLQPAGSSVPLRSGTDDVVVAEVAPLPSRSGFRLGAVAMVALPRARPADAAPEGLVAAAMGLTSAEAEIAVRIGSGADVEEIAAERSVKPDTVRTQLKSIYSKTGASSQLQLCVRVGALLGGLLGLG